MSRPTVIYLDVDGVLVDFHTAAFDLFDVKVDLNDVDDWGAMPRVASAAAGREITPRQFWNRVSDAGAEFWRSMKWLPNGREILRVCNELAPTILVTATALPQGAAGKMQWMHQEVPDQAYAITEAKHLLAHPGALLIDDADHNVGAFHDAGGQTLLVPQPWNFRRGGAFLTGEIRERFA